MPLARGPSPVIPSHVFPPALGDTSHRLRLCTRAVPAVRRGRADAGARDRRQRRRGRGLRRRRPVGLGPQGRDRERRAQPRQVDGHHGLHRPAARQRQHLRLLARRARADRARGARHRALHRRGCRCRPARCAGHGERRRRAARPRPVPPLGDRRRACAADRAALRGRGLRRRPAHHQLRGRRRLGAAVALLRRQQPRLSGRLREFAPFAVGRTDRIDTGPAWRRHAARCLVQLDAGRRRDWPRPKPSAATRPSVRCRV